MPDLVQLWPQLDGVAEMPMGDAACLEIDGVDVIVTSIRDQAFGLELFTAFGIDPRQKRLLVLKSANHFRAAFDAIAQDVVYVDAGGALPVATRAPCRTRASIGGRIRGLTIPSSRTASDSNRIAVSARVDANDGVRGERQRKRAVCVGVLAAGAEGGGVCSPRVRPSSRPTGVSGRGLQFPRRRRRERGVSCSRREGAGNPPACGRLAQPPPAGSSRSTRGHLNYLFAGIRKRVVEREHTARPQDEQLGQKVPAARPSTCATPCARSRSLTEHRSPPGT